MTLLSISRKFQVDTTSHNLRLIVLNVQNRSSSAGHGGVKKDISYILEAFIAVHNRNRSWSPPENMESLSNRIINYNMFDRTCQVPFGECSNFIMTALVQNNL